MSFFAVHQGQPAAPQAYHFAGENLTPLRSGYRFHVGRSSGLH